MKTNVKAYKDKDLIKRVENLPTFKGWKKGKYSIWVRSEEDEYNVFDDKVYNFEVKEEGKPIFISVNTGTTNAGAQGLKEFTAYNKLGCAVLMADHMEYNSHHWGFHKSDPKRPAYRQTKGWPYTRDNDKDNKSENFGKIYTDVIGANQHDSGIGDKVFIGGYSVACLVRNQKKQYDAWMKFMNKESLHTVILKEF
jgi:hypothetical protein